MRASVAVVASVGVAILVTATGYTVDASADEREALGPGIVTVEVGIDQSTFDLGTLRVREGTLVELVVHNRDPIDHELVVGTAEVHRRHAEGDEGRHPPVPGEVSVGPLDTAKTFYEFTEAGSVVYACHLPGHVAYGMQGTIEVVE